MSTLGRSCSPSFLCKASEQKTPRVDKSQIIRQTTEAAIQRICTSPPACRVRGRASNVSGRYPLVKMGCSIQFESQVEFLAIYAMERDDDVLEYYDQPTRIQLHYRSLRGQKTSPWHTPDFLVIPKNNAKEIYLIK
jgi:putative transposase